MLTPGLDDEMPGSNLGEYLTTSAELIRARIRELTDSALASAPPWVRTLGNIPADAVQRTEWERHVGIVAAYRDQYQVTAEEPDQILGPYVKPERSERIAYWQAAESVAAARALSADRPTEAAVTERRPAEREARMAARLERARQARQRLENSRQKQRNASRGQEAQAEQTTPLMQPSAGQAGERRDRQYGR